MEVMLERTSNGFDVTIADSGVGIGEADLERIFDEFSQFDYPGKYKPVGFGLGLAIVATMVNLIGASLVVSSAIKIGTAFTLNVPDMKARKSN